MWRCFGWIVIIAALAAGRASAQDSAAQFYNGKQITMIVGSSAGGGYDIYARLVSRHMPKHIPGNPAVVMAGSIKLTSDHDWDMVPYPHETTRFFLPEDEQPGTTVRRFPSSPARRCT